MPAFPAFKQRLAQINNPMNRGVAETPMEYGIPMGGVQGANQRNPMMRRPMGDQGAIPLVQGNELPPASGTAPEPGQQPTRKMVDKIKERVASEARYEDLAPKMEEIPGTPAFNPKPVKGIGGRIKAAFQSAGAAMQMNPGSPYAGLVGLAAGAIKPDIAQGLDYKGRVLPEARRQQAEVMARNDARQKSFGVELANRERLAKIQQMNDPEWSSVAGGEYPSLYDKRSGETRQVMGPDGQPLKNAGIINTKERTDSAEEIAHIRKLAAVEHDVQKKQADFEKAKQKFDFDKEKLEIQSRHKAELEAFKQKKTTERTNIQQAGASGRAAAAEAGRNKRHKERRGDDDDTPTKPAAEHFPNIFQTPKLTPNSFALPPREKQQKAPPAK